MTRKIIGIVGKKGSGKDTAGEYLIEKYGYVRFAFGDKVKEVAKALFNFSDEQLYGKLKDSIDERYNLKPRQVFQRLGTEFGQYDIHKLFSSKKKTYEILTKKKIPVVKIERKVKKNSNFIFVTKPIYGAGSENVCIIKPKSDIKNDNHLIIQKYYEGIKGSFSMICKGKSSQVLSCSEQITDIKNKKIFQKGLIVGGLEKYREDFEKISKKIISKFTGLFGFIGVDVIKIENVWHILEINTRFTSSLLGIENAYGIDAIKKITNLYLNKKVDKKKIKLKKTTKVYFN